MLNLPKWVIPDKYPALYDLESATVLEMVSKLYGSMQTLISDYNEYVTTLNKNLDTYESEMTTANECFKNTMETFVDNFIKCVDIRIDKQDLKLANAINDIVSTAKSVTEKAIADGEVLVDAVARESVNTVNNEMSVLKNRMTTFTTLAEGSTTGDAELIDVRNGADGVIYESAGEAVRKQIDTTTKTFCAINEEISGAKFYPFSNGYYRLGVDGTVIDTNAVIYDIDLLCTKVPCVEGEKITINGDGDSGIKRLYAFVDADGTVLYLSSVNIGGLRTITAPANCAYALINVLKTSENPFVYKGENITKTTKEQTDIIEGSVSYTTKDFEQGAIASTGKEGNSTVYCRTDFIDIDVLKHVVKPSGSLSVLIAQYDENKAFIDRITSDLPTKSIDYDRKKINLYWNTNGNVKYVRFSVKREIDGVEVNSTPDDIINAGLNIELYGVSDAIYNKVVNLERAVDPENSGVPLYYSDYITEKINTINSISDNVGEQNDNFVFLTDYHWQSNAGNSFALIKHIASRTGVSKMFFGGDAGKSSIASDKYEASRLNADIYSKFADCVPNFYGVTGNHEWNDRQDEAHETSKQAEVYSRNGIVNFYLKRNNENVATMSEEGNFYIDNEVAKIRYILIQTTGQGRVTNATCEWLIDTLNNVPNAYNVVLFSHAVFDGWAHASNYEQYYGDRCRMSVLRLSEIMGAYKNRSTGSINKLADYFDENGTAPFVTGSINYNFANAKGEPVCIIGGHNHKDANRIENGVLIIQTTTDAYKANEDTETVREVGTTSEQAFDVFHVDATNRRIYTTRIGGGSDREFSF